MRSPFSLTRLLQITGVDVSTQKRQLASLRPFLIGLMTQRSRVQIPPPQPINVRRKPLETAALFISGEASCVERNLPTPDDLDMEPGLVRMEAGIPQVLEGGGAIERIVEREWPVNMIRPVRRMSIRSGGTYS
jgi:hypothetical protein